MTGGELTAVLLFGILCALGAVCAVARAWQETRTAVARAQVEIATKVAGAQAGPFFAPDWSRDGGL